MSKKAIGISKCYYSTVTFTDGVPTFGTPNRIPDLETLTITDTFAEGKNFADNVCNIVIRQLTGATISAEFSNVSRKIEAEFGGKEYKAGQMESRADDVQKAVALMFEKNFDDGSAERVVYYNCKLTREGNGGQTKTDNINFTGVTLAGSAIPLPDGRVSLVIASDEMEADAGAKAKYDAFFTEVAEYEATP